MPAFSGMYEALCVRNPGRMTTGKPLAASLTNRAASVATPTSVHRMPTTWKIRSCHLRCEINFATSPISIRLVITPPEPITEQIECQCHRKQHEPRCKNRLITDCATRRFALANRHDIGGDRLSGLRGIDREPGNVASRQSHDHRFTDRPRDAEDVSSADPRECRRNHDPPRREQLVGPQS